MASKKPVKAANDEAAEVVTLPANMPKSADLMEEATLAVDGIITLEIDSPMMYELAAAELVDLQEKRAKIEGQRFSITRPMDAAKKAVMDLFRTPIEKLDGAIATLKAGMLVYDKEQKRKAAIKQTLLDKIADNQRAQLAAEGVRQAEEAREQADLAAALIASGNSAGANEALSRAEAAQEMASALNQTTAVVSAATAETNVPTVGGITTADVWKARVTDLPALLRFIADNPQYHDWVELKMSGLNEMAKAQRDALSVPGIVAFEEARISASRKAA